MSTTKRYLIIIGVAVIVAVAAIAYYMDYAPKREAFVNTAEARIVVAGLGDELRSVSLLAPAADIQTAMDKHYSYYVRPDLLAKWKADPKSAPGRLTSSPYPDRIDVTETVKNEDGTYTVTANIVEVANAAQGKQDVNSIPVKFTVTLGPDGWQISGYQKL